MRYLLDTHTLIWFLENDNMLSLVAEAAIRKADNECFISVASIWELAIKYGLGKIKLRGEFSRIAFFLTDNNIKILPLEFQHLHALLALEFIHRDPFDRLIVAQAIAEDLTILTVDPEISKYPVKCLW